MQNYRSELIQAIERSRKYNLDVSDFYLDGKRESILDETIKYKLVSLFEKEVYCYGINEVAMRCIHVAICMQKAIESIISCETIITIGYIDFLGKSAFYEPLEVIDAWFQDETIYVPQNRNIHVWLTLPTVEIIDITVLASFMKAAPNLFGEAYDFRKSFLGFPNDEDATKFVHRPQFVGNDFLYKTGLAVDYHLD